MNRVGRPIKHEDREQYQELRKQQNRNNQRRCRGRKKLLEDIDLMNPSQFNKKYQTDLLNYINQYQFDYFFTGTIDPSKMEKQELWENNQQTDRENQELETETGYVVERKVGIRTLRKYTEKYLQFLSELNLFERSFVVFEIGKNNNYHVHIMFQSNPQKINFEITTENTWLMGNSITLPISNTQTDKTKLIGYCLKELKPSTTIISDINKVDNWFLSGDYSKEQLHSIPLKEEVSIFQS